jgi:hypothetical protein
MNLYIKEKKKHTSSTYNKYLSDEVKKKKLSTWRYLIVYERLNEKCQIVHIYTLYDSVYLQINKNLEIKI